MKTQNKDNIVNKIYERSCDQNYTSVLYLAMFMWAHGTEMCWERNWLSSTHKLHVSAVADNFYVQQSIQHHRTDDS